MVGNALLISPIVEEGEQLLFVTGHVKSTCEQITSSYIFMNTLVLNGVFTFCKFEKTFM